MIRYNINGTIDSSFGTGGIVKTATGYIDHTCSIALQSDGRILVAGGSTIIRYNTNGSIDTTFGTNGISTIDIFLSDTYVHSLLIQKDGKIIAAGYSLRMGAKFTIVRFNLDGTLDSTFGTDGVTITQIGSSNDRAYSASLQDDGKIVVTGNSDTGDDYDFATVRYNTNGVLDTTFGTNGIVISAIGNSYDIANTIKIQNDNKIVIAGNSQIGNFNHYAVIRYNPDGSLDNNFGTNGIATSLSVDEANSLSIQSDGKIIISGAVDVDYRGNNFVLVRYNSNGTLDNAFGENGIVINRIGYSRNYANSLTIQNDGKIVVAGNSYTGRYSDFAIVRYNKDGILDNSFGENGIVTTPIGYADDLANSLVIQHDGKIVVGGAFDDGTNYNIAIVRYNSNGNLDSTFGSNGIVKTKVGNSSGIKSLAIQSDDKILAVCQSAYYDFALVRFNTDGTLDNTFGESGIVITPIGSSADYSTSVGIQIDEKIVVAGYYLDGINSGFALVRYNTNGTIDNTFGTNGIVTTPTGFSENYAEAMIIQSDDKIIVTGYSFNGANNDFLTIRYNSNGSLDNSFGNSGIVITPIGNSDDLATSVKIQSDNKIVVSGASNIGFFSLTLARYNMNGTLDNTFGNNGIIISPIGTSPTNTSLAIQEDDKIIVAGSSWDGNNNVFTVIRYLSNPQVGINESKEKVLTLFKLEQNYPNPFNPNTKPRFVIRNFLLIEQTAS